MMRTVPVMALVMVTGLMLCLPIHMDATTVAPSERLGDVEGTSNTVVEIMSALSGGEWTERHPASAPSPRLVNWMAYDSLSDKVILFGGRFSYYGCYNETWAYDFDTDTWTNMTPPAAPSSRWSHAMAYDSQSNRVILFGGSNQLENFNDTWAFNYEQNEWTNMNPSVAPSPRGDYGMAYDSQSDRVILFGGYAGYDSDETWSYDFETNSWTNMNPTSRPPARFTPAIAYDIQSDRVLIFGGIGGGLRDDMWAYDFESNTWTEMHPAVKPPPSYGARFSYDSHADRVVMFGGDDPNPPYYHNDTWTYDFDADVWTKVDTKGPGRSYHGMAYDSRSARSIIFGGGRGSPTEIFNDTWTFLELAAHDPILIDGNAEFTDANGVVAGSGTESDPYVIVGWDISASTANGIEIRNTDAHFIIRDCYVHDGLSFSHVGIFLSNCVNGNLENNNCSNNWDGMELWSSSNNNTLTGNTCSNNYLGMELSSSSSNIISSNKVFNNADCGVDINSGSNNRIWNNTFIGNNGSVSIYDSNHIQAYDDGTDNSWNSSDGYGNYWSDWTGPDADKNGIVDAPYGIAGSAGAEDNFPLAAAPHEHLPHAPITISGDTGFTPANGVVRGNGTQIDPYVIEGWQIDTSTQTGIDITSTSSYVVIQDVLLSGGSEYSVGIMLSDCRHVVISQCTVSNFGVGISLNRTEKILISESQVSSSRSDGILILSSSNVRVLQNDIQANSWKPFHVWPCAVSIQFPSFSMSSSSDNITVGGNSIHDNLGSAIGVGTFTTDTKDIIIASNTVSRNTDGIWTWETRRIAICGNHIEDTSFAVYLELTEGARIWGNNFVNSTYPGYDDGGAANQWNDSYPIGGNYWSDYVGSDNKSGPAQNIDGSDGIGDTPYVIDYNSADNYPLISIVEPTAPSSPWNPQAIPDDGQVILLWQAPSSDGRSQVTGYRIYRGTSPGSEAFLLELGNVLTYTDTGLTNGATYYYQISAVNGIGEGPRSDEVLAIPYAPAPPSEPIDLLASPGDALIILTWQPPVDDRGSPITNYRIYRGDAPGNEYILVELGNVLAYTDTGLTNGVPYYYEVSAVNEVGEGPLSGEVSATPVPPVPVPWPMFRQNARHTGLSPVDTPTNAGLLVWSYSASGLAQNSPAIAADGAIYIGSTYGTLRAFEPSGTLRWSLDTGDPIYSSPAIGADGTIYFGAGKSLYAVNPDGAVKWSYEIWGDAYDRIECSPVIGSDGTIYIGSHAARLYAFNPDGTVKWYYSTPSSLDVLSSPAIGADGTIYFGDDGNYLYAVTPGGGLVWKFETSGDVTYSSPCIGDDGTTYIGSGHYLDAVDSSGALKWSFYTGGRIDSSPGIGPDGTIYFGSNDYNLYAVYPNGTQRWKLTSTSCVESSPAIGSDGTIYFGSWDGMLRAIRLDGTQRWAYYTGYVYRSSPAIGADGTVYVSSDSGLYAIGGALYPPSAPQLLTATPGDGEVTLFWSAPENDGGSPVTGYTIYRGLSSGTETPLTTIGNLLTYTDTGLTNGVTYYYQASAVNAAGEGPRSGEVWATPTAPPTCTIDSPASDPFYTTIAQVGLSGTASDDIEVASVTWSNAATGASGTATGTTSWDIVHISLDPGSNVITVTSHDDSGLTGTDTITVVRDNANPSCTIAIPPADPYYTNSAAVSLSGTASDNTEVVGVTWINAATGESGTASGTTSWTISSITLNAGSNLIYVNSTDAAGNYGIDTITIVRDNTAPSCTITSPTNLATHTTAGSTVNLGGTSSDDILVAQISWKNMATGSSGTATGTTSWSIAGISLDAGNNLIYVNSTDEAGNKGSDAITVTRDSTAPTCTITSPTSLSMYYTTASTIDIGGTASDNIGVTQVTWKNMATGLSGTAASTTTWSITGISLSAGSNLVYVNASDAVSNVGSDTITVTRDSTAPTCTITSPTGNPTYSTGVSTIDLSGSASDNIGVSSVNWSNAATGATGTASGTTSWTITGMALNVGSNLVTVTAYDAAGNTGSDSITVIYTPLAELAANGTASPTSGTKPLSVSFTCTPSGGASPYTYSWAFGDGGTSTQKNPSHVYNSTGTFTVTVTVTDSASHTAQWTTTLTVTSGGGTSWLPIALVGIVAAVAVGTAMMLLMRRKGKVA
jgi:parallel beta-helix repeat protein